MNFIEDDGTILRIKDFSYSSINLNNLYPV